MTTRPFAMDDLLQRMDTLTCHTDAWSLAVESNLVPPAVRVGGRPALDVHQGLSQPHRHGSRVAAGDLPASVRRLHLADGRDHRGGAPPQHPTARPIRAAL